MNLNPAHVVEQYTEILNAYWNVQTQEFHTFGRMYNILDVGGKWRTKISLIHTYMYVVESVKCFQKFYRRVAGCGHNRSYRCFAECALKADICGGKCTRIWHLWGNTVPSSITSVGFSARACCYAIRGWVQYSFRDWCLFSVLLLVFKSHYSSATGKRVHVITMLFGKGV